MNSERLKTYTIVGMGLVILVLLLVSEPRKGIRNDLLLRKALRSVKERDFVEAEAAYRQVLRRDPQSARALRGMGSLHALEEDYDRAIDFYRKAVALGDLPSLRMLVGMYIKTDQPEEIREYVSVLMRHKAENQEFLNAVLVYVIATKDRSLFDEAMAGVPSDYVAAREDTSQLVRKAEALLSEASGE